MVALHRLESPFRWLTGKAASMKIISIISKLSWHRGFEILGWYFPFFLYSIFTASLVIFKGNIEIILNVESFK